MPVQSGVPPDNCFFDKIKNIASQVPRTAGCHFVVAGFHDLSCFSWEGVASFDEKQSKSKLQVKELLPVFIVRGRVLYCTSLSVSSYSRS